MKDGKLTTGKTGRQSEIQCGRMEIKRLTSPLNPYDWISPGADDIGASLSALIDDQRDTAGRKASSALAYSKQISTKNLPAMIVKGMMIFIPLDLCEIR